MKALLAVCAFAGFAVPGFWVAAQETSPHDHPKPTVLAPGYADLEFIPPVAGTYALPSLGTAGGGRVLDTQGQSHRLERFLGDKIVVLSFIYTTCNDINGCPLATHVLRKLQNALREDESLADKVRLLSLSFDPDHDTPSVLTNYAKFFKAEDFDWQFLTTTSKTELAPILESYDQWVIRDYDEDGNYLGTMSHLLRVFLVDEEKRIRNIYSVSFLHADTVANDIRTILLDTHS